MRLRISGYEKEENPKMNLGEGTNQSEEGQPPQRDAETIIRQLQNAEQMKHAEGMPTFAYPSVLQPSAGVIPQNYLPPYIAQQTWPITPQEGTVVIESLVHDLESIGEISSIRPLEGLSRVWEVVSNINLLQQKAPGEVGADNLESFVQTLRRRMDEISTGVDASGFTISAGVPQGIYLEIHFDKR